jgi:hypothetical protein
VNRLGNNGLSRAGIHRPALIQFCAGFIPLSVQEERPPLSHGRESVGKRVGGVLIGGLGRRRRGLNRGLIDD